MALENTPFPHQTIDFLYWKNSALKTACNEIGCWVLFMYLMLLGWLKTIQVEGIFSFSSVFPYLRTFRVVKCSVLVSLGGPGWVKAGFPNNVY